MLPPVAPFSYQPSRLSFKAPLSTSPRSDAILPAAVRFGKGANARDEQDGFVAVSLEKLNRFASMRGALKKAMPKYHHTIEEDLYTNYLFKLTFDRAQRQISKLLHQVSAEDLSQFHQMGKLGLVEESSDMFFEMYTLKALYNGLITKDQVKAWADKVPVAPEDGQEVSLPDLLNGTRFQAHLQQIRKDIKERAEKEHPWRFKHFCNSVDAGWGQPQADSQKDRAMDLLALIGMKFALMTRKNPNYRLWGDNINLLWDEAKEFREEMHGDSPSDSPTKLLVAFMATLYSLPLMPYKPFQFVITKLAARELNHQPDGSGLLKAQSGAPQSQQFPRFDVGYKDLMETVFSKQIGRQELDFSRPDIDGRLEMRPDIRLNKDAMKNGNAKRKCILKPYELWQESAVLKNAQKASEKESDIAGKVLNTGL